MKTQEWVCTTIIIAGLITSVWQINRIKEGEHSRTPLFSMFSDPINVNRPANLAIQRLSSQDSDCATRNLIFKVEKVVFELTAAGVDALTLISNAR